MEAIGEFLILRALFNGIKDKKRLIKMRDDFQRDMQINFVTGQVTRSTYKLGYYISEYSENEPGDR